MNGWKYKVLFPVTTTHEPSKTEWAELIKVLLKFDVSASDLPAGYTYLGQFIIHDLSFQGIRPSNGSQPIVDRLFSRNKPVLDLDGVYGNGLSDPAIPFNQMTGAFVLGPAGAEPDSDLPRDDAHKARIGDRRNDDNLLVAQMQVLFMRFHNRIVEDLLQSEDDPNKLFQRAKAEVTKAYRYLVLHEFVKRLVPESVYEAIVLEGRGKLSDPNPADPTLALEFADAAARLHSLVRESYELNDRSGTIGFARITELTGGKTTRTPPGPLLEADDVVDWRHFFEFSNYPDLQKSWQPANALSFVVNTFMRDVRDPVTGGNVDMFKKNIHKAPDHGLCTGQQACEALRQMHPGLPEELGIQTIDGNDFVLGQLSAQNSVRTQTPLWIYLMREATAGKLGVLGGWIVADTLRTAALNADPAATQATNLYGKLMEVAKNRSEITIEDVIQYTYDYHGQRRQP